MTVTARRDGTGRATHDDDGSVDEGSNEPAREGIDERLGRLHGSPAAERGPPAAAERRWGERGGGGERERDGRGERERDGRGDASDDDERARAGENVGIRPAASAQSTGGGERALEGGGGIVRRCVETTGERRRECECECECARECARDDGRRVTMKTRWVVIRTREISCVRSRETRGIERARARRDARSVDSTSSAGDRACSRVGCKPSLEPRRREGNGRERRLHEGAGGEGEGEGDDETKRGD